MVSMRGVSLRRALMAPSFKCGDSSLEFPKVVIIQTDLKLFLGVRLRLDIQSRGKFPSDPIPSTQLTHVAQVSLIWKSKWSLPKVLFILSRYSTVFDVPLVLYCKLDLSMEWRR
jgi:hypothetical protein